LNGNEDEAFTILRNFMSELVPVLPLYLP